MSHFEYVGNLHIHSLYSDGSAAVSEIARSAAAAGLDFICLNDHDYLLDRLHLEDEGFYGDVLVLVGLEIGERYHHYLAYGLKEMVRGQGLGPQEVIDQVNEQDGFGFLAHPFEKGMPFTERSLAYTWNDLTVTGYTGLSIWNFTSRWKERIKTAIHGLFFLTFKDLGLKAPSEKTLTFWDGLCQQRRVVAVGGSDAHGSTFKLGFISFMPLKYDHLFKTINIHVLLQRALSKDIEGAKEEIYGAMKAGRLFVAHDKIGSARGFGFSFTAEGGARLIMGEEGPFSPGHLKIKLPAHGEIRLIKDGRPQGKWRGTEAGCRVVEKGVYRAEAYRRSFLFGWRPWIFSNPIYLR